MREYHLDVPHFHTQSPRGFPAVAVMIMRIVEYGRTVLDEGQWTDIAAWEGADCERTITPEATVNV